MPEPHVFIVFGATGDLMRRKLMPALYDLFLRRGESESVILGVSRSDLSDDDFREAMREALVEHTDLDEKEAQSWCASCVHFQQLESQTEEAFAALRDRIEAIEAERGLPGNRVFYLSLPPSAFTGTIERLGAVGLNRSEGWTRIVVEKPFGHDLESARELNALVHEHFDESQIYRIDHYLGKESVQNLLVFRLGNPIFESLWNREHVEHVDILVAEDLGVGTRAGYFDRTGTFRDMVQNHLTQLLTLVAMEVPATAEADAIRFEKIKVLRSIEAPPKRDIVFGQYTRGQTNGEALPGYREADGVESDSTTETYVALCLHINNWRWQGVPFVLRTGKRLPHRLTEITVTFRHPPVSFFASADGPTKLHANVLRITLQPDEGFSLSFDVKKPGSEYRTKTEELRFRYGDAFGELPDAYRTLLEDIMRGDQTQFVHAQEVETAWGLYDSVLDADLPISFYAAGTWGPHEAEKFMN